MFKKAILSLFIINLLFGNISLLYALQTDAERAALTDQMASDLGISQNAWFSSSKRTINFISSGLFQIDALNDSLRAKGVSEATIAASNAKMIAALQEFAKASHAQENNRIWTTDATEHERDAKLLETKGKFEKTIAEVSAENGLDEQAAIYTDAAAEMQRLANESYVKSGKSVNIIDTTLAQIKTFATVEGDYTLLAPVETFFPGGKIALKGDGLSRYLNGLYRAGVAIATGLALLMIVIGGLEYVSTDSIQGKSNGRERIKNAVIGLLLALASFIILNQINPNLLKSDLGLDSTGSTGNVKGVDVALSNGNAAIDPLAAYPYTQNLVNSSISGTQFNIYGSTPNGSVSFVAAPGSRVIGGGKVKIDYDGSPGAYRLTESPNGPYVIRGKRYVSSGYEHVANARSDIATSTAAMKSSGKWVGVLTASDGEPVINSDGSLIGVLSIGAGKVNGDTTAFVALSAGQVAAASSTYGVILKPSLSTTIILTANGKSIKAIYADYAGIRPTDYSEVSPAAARALGLSFGKQNGKSYATGSVIISLP